MAKLLYDHYVDTGRRADAPADGQRHEYTLSPPGANYVLLGAFGAQDWFDSANSKQYSQPVSARIVGDDVVFHVQFDDGQGGTGNPVQVHLTAIFAKEYEIFP